MIVGYLGICSHSGGRIVPENARSAISSFDPGVLVKRTYHLNYETSSRYYYDTEQGNFLFLLFILPLHFINL